MMRKIFLFCLVTLGLAGAAWAQESVVYWTGLGNRWGGGSHENFSTEPRGTTFTRVVSGGRYHFVFNSNAMTGKRTKVRVNREDVTLLSFNLASPRQSGFSFDTTADSSSGMVLAGMVNVVAGQHELENSGVVDITLAANVAWNIAEGARLINRIPLAGAFGITKTGGGALITRQADHAYTGDTVIAEGAFGGSGSLAGNLHFAAGSRYQFNPNATLAVAGKVTFERFAVKDIANLDDKVANGAYTLFRGEVDFSNVGNLGSDKAHPLGSRKIAYFSAGDGGMQLVVESRGRLRR